MSSNIVDVPLHNGFDSTKNISRDGSGYATPTHDREVAMIPRAASVSLMEKQNRALSESVGRDRMIKEQKMLAQRKLVHFQEEEANIFEANLKEARQLYESQLVEGRLTEWRQKIQAEDLLKDETRKADLVNLVNKMSELKIQLTLQDEARDREVAFRAKMKLRREAFQARVKKLEERQKKEREELVITQERIAKNLKMIQALEIRGMDESRRRKALREFEIQSQQLAMRQQKEAEQLREMQLLKIRHMSEAAQLEFQSMTELEEVTTEQKEREGEMSAEHRALVRGEEDKLERQQAKLKALQITEEQKIQRNHLKQQQRKQGKILDRQQRHSAKIRERAAMAENSAIVGQEVALSSAGSETDGSESLDASSYAASSDYGGDGQEREEVDQMMDMETRAAMEKNQAADAENRRKRQAANDAVGELEDSLKKGRERIVALATHHRKLVEDLRSFHKDARNQRAREHKRKAAELMKDHEDEIRAVKTEQAQEMEELIATLGNQELIAAQQSSFDKQMDTVVSNQLLGNMLPKFVAEELKAGKTPEPSSFDNVCLFFTDIAGFKELAVRSTPRQIVALLNRMYVAFDNVIAHYEDLYKVETVGDSFMVCAGVMGDSGKTDEDHIRDASSAIECALELMEAAAEIDMSDQIIDKLNLRVGIQCGPVLAGVIGTKMPHFCLFGDTVNTASRMCSTSEALKIQVSSTVYETLKDAYAFEERGAISVKGKGQMTTYWLKGRKTA
ncbi:hypothetical protein HK097_010672 [Rhizophlyctis rosea]|uniref:Guanylate cyclase domain-containing protein n=1 Tax=Rhizophlyctis rosea TaxID=64517 RepID=A0AAD5SIJ9_9FUNG|nr:hypothetical protein HK097_010672 [Rhizophlyctis rosea]